MDGVFHKPLTEQMARVELLLSMVNLAKEEPVTRHRLLLTAVYPSVAIAELMVRNPTQENSGEEEELEERLSETVPYYSLLKNVRVHDFHRTTVMPPIAGRITIMESGPMHLTARQGGSAQISGVGPGKTLQTTRNSSIKEDRPLQTMDGLIWDDASSEWVDLFDMLSAYVEGIRPFIEEREGSKTDTERADDATGKK